MKKVDTDKSMPLEGAGERHEQETVAARETSWTFLTNHAHVIICLTQQPEARMRDVALKVGVTERAVQRIIADLEEAGIITRLRDGRCNHYVIHKDKPLRHPVEQHRTVGDLVNMASSQDEEAE